MSGTSYLGWVERERERRERLVTDRLPHARVRWVYSIYYARRIYEDRYVVEQMDRNFPVRLVRCS